MQTTIRQRVFGIWQEIPQTWRDEIISVTHTFVGAFGFELAFQVQPLLASGNLPTGRDALVALGIAATRSAFKYAWIATQKLVSDWIAARRQPGNG